MRPPPRPAPVCALLLAVALLPACGPDLPPPGPNVLLISIDALRADHVAAVHDGVPLTPHLDELAERAAVFESAYAAAAFTLPSLHTIATGEPPPVHRARFWTKFGNRFTGPTLASLLRERGYRTAFVSGHGLLGPYPVLRRGFDVFEERREARGAWVVERSESFLDGAAGTPFLLWVHVYEPHTPYAPEDEHLLREADREPYHAAGPAAFPVEEWLPKVPATDAAKLADRLYAAEVRAADAAVGRLLAALGERGRDRDTVVCVVSDHGESLSWDDGPRWDHGWSVDRHLVHVPLLLAGPGVDASRRADLAAHLDLAPTLLALTGQRPQDGWLGRDLLTSTPPPRFAVVESSVPTRQDEPFYGVTDGRFSLRLDPAEGAFRLVDERDGGSPPQPVDLLRPAPLAAPYVEHWNALAALWRERAALLNDPSVPETSLTAEQEQVLTLAGYLR